jgi:hypothetical protein
VLVVGFSCQLGAQESTSFFDEKQTTQSNVRMTVNTLGGIGNSFKGSFNDPARRFSSCEYPAGSSTEHIFEGGLWIGAIVGGQVRVSTGAIDDPAGYSTGKAGFEFTAAPGTRILERSSKIDNTLFYTPNAVSHQDFVSRFTDKNTVVPGTTTRINEHDNPLGAEVLFETYNWDFLFANYMVFLNYEITNAGTETWNDVYLGFWVDPVVRNLLRTPAGQGGSAFYDKGGTGYLDSLYTGYEFDATGDVPFTDSYVAFRFLGVLRNDSLIHPRLDPNFKVHFNSWSFRDFLSAYPTPRSDPERYDRMKEGLNDAPDWDLRREIIRRPRNSSLLLSAGPLPRMLPGEKVRLCFAVVLARKTDDGNPTSADTPEQRAELTSNLVWAQNTFNGEDRNFNGVLDPGEDSNEDSKLTRFLLPEPPPPPRDTIIAGPNSIKIFFANNAEEAIDPISRKKDFEGYRLYKTSPGFELTDNAQDILRSLQLVAQYDRRQSAGFLPESRIVEFNTGFDELLPQTEEDRRFARENGYTYMFEFKNVLDGWQHGVAVTAFDQGEAENNLEPLESSPLVRLRRVFSGTRPNNDFDNGDPFVYPNPYYGSAAWESRGGAEEDRRIMFANLPARAEVSIYTTAGDLVYSFQHDGRDQGLNTRWYQSFAATDGTQQRVFSGGEHAWNLLSRDNQIIARGIYLFTVKDLDSGTIKRGSFVVIK